MKHSIVASVAIAACSLMTACTSSVDEADTPSSPTAVFEYLEYTGNDPVFEGTLAPGEMLNPILAGFYPDPSLVRVGSDFYLVNSTFSYFPGIPVFHSTDLMNWTQIGNVIDRPGMLDFDGLGMSRGVFAPTIAYHDGVFYVANTCVDCGGNFIVTATDPAGPWSDPVWIPEVGGIDPSLFFDDDGKIYLMNNDEPPGGSTYDGHRAVWIREIDPETLQPIAEPVVVVDGGARPEDKPIWIEGPHIYRMPDGYLFSAAEGGTSVNHSQVVFKADKVTGPYIPYENNPILTQRDLPEDRAYPVTSTGHADIFQDDNGDWWAIFLATRPYEDDYYNTGRETFLLPVEFKDGWPIILPPQTEVPYRIARPDLPDSGPPSTPTTGNYTVREDFDGDKLPLQWMFPRVPKAPWHTLANGELSITPGDATIGSGGQPSLAAYRVKHMNATGETLVRAPTNGTDEAGITVFQNDDYWYALALKAEAGQQRLTLDRRAGAEDPIAGTELASELIDLAPGEPVELKIAVRGALCDFYYRVPGEAEWQTVATDQDARILSTHIAGGFIGSVFGLYAQPTGDVSD